MRYTTAVAAIAMAMFAKAAPIPTITAASTADNGRVDFISTDGFDRTVDCTCNPGFTCPKGLSVPAGQTTTYMFGENFQGTCYAFIVGEPNTGRGMLAEITFGGWNNLTYYDVSAIVCPNDTRNIYAMLPGNSDSPVSGCMDGVVGLINGEMACKDNMYVAWDDVQTKSTPSNHIRVFMGPPDGSSSATTSTAPSTASSTAPSTVPVAAVAAAAGSPNAAIAIAAIVSPTAPSPTVPPVLTTVVTAPAETVTVWVSE